MNRYESCRHPARGHGLQLLTTIAIVALPFMQGSLSASAEKLMLTSEDSPGRIIEWSSAIDTTKSGGTGIGPELGWLDMESRRKMAKSSLRLGILLMTW